MSWFSSVVFYMGIFDAGLIMVGGLVASFVILMGWDAKALWERVAPALGMVIASNVAAAIILAVTKWVGGF